MDFGSAFVAFLNIGLFSSLVARFTGANMSIMVFVSLLYIGCTPVETIGAMMTYLVFMKLTAYTQHTKLNFKHLTIFKGWKLWVALLLMIALLFFYPFAALAVFLFVFMLEILVPMWRALPENQSISSSQLTHYIIGGSLLTVIPMIVVKFIPESFYYIIGGLVGLALCVFIWWLGQDRSRLERSWDKVVMLLFIPMGLFGFDLQDWLDDMRRSLNHSHIAYNLPFIFLPCAFAGFVAANVLYGIFSLSGMIVVFFGAIGMRLFGYYEVSRKGKANLISLGITVLALFLLFLTAPEPVGVTHIVDAYLPSNNYGFTGILNMF